jgi:hypothetical protein
VLNTYLKSLSVEKRTPPPFSNEKRNIKSETSPMNFEEMQIESIVKMVTPKMQKKYVSLMQKVADANQPLKPEKDTES